jgi:hypothetical protein
MRRMVPTAWETWVISLLLLGVDLREERPVRLWSIWPRERVVHQSLVQMSDVH